MNKPLNYFGLAFNDPEEGLNPLFIQTKEGQKYIKECKKEYKKHRKILYKRGFDDTELYNLDCTIAQFVLPRLKRFKKIYTGFPANLKSDKAWKKKISKMITAFELVVKKCNDDFLDLEEEEKVQKGLKLFAKYFMHLWV